MSLETEHREFLLAEFSDRREHFHRHVQQIVADQRYGIFASGVFWAWLGTHTIDASVHWLAWIPSVLVVFFFVKWIVFHFSAMRIVAYLAFVEEQFELPSGLGWCRNYKSYGRDWLAPFTTLYWCILLLVNIAAALIYPVVPAIAPVQ